MEDRLFCMNSFLTYRYIADATKSFDDGVKPYFFSANPNKFHISSVQDVSSSIRQYVNEILKAGGKIGLALSGGIDSAILAKFVPANTQTYTFHCIAPGALDETEAAKQYADICSLPNKVIDVTWEDYMAVSPVLMKHKGAPIHSIEPQIYKAACVAKNDGITHLLFGENADIIFGGMDGLLAKDWTFDEFVQRYTYLDPRKILKEGKQLLGPFEKYRNGNMIDFYGFICDFFYYEANNSYDNACSTAGVVYSTPFNRMKLDFTLDFQRIRSGDTKYMLRELFNELYPQLGQPKKIPMPRAVTQWLADWDGPKRPEFIPHCADGLKGDQRWMIFVLEMFLNLLDNGKK